MTNKSYGFEMPNKHYSSFLKKDVSNLPLQLQVLVKLVILKILLLLEKIEKKRKSIGLGSLVIC